MNVARHMSVSESRAVCWKYHMSPNRKKKNISPTDTIIHPIGRLMMNAVRDRGASCITDSEGGNVARAIAAKVSIIRFTHSI